MQFLGFNKYGFVSILKCSVGGIGFLGRRLYVLNFFGNDCRRLFVTQSNKQVLNLVDSLGFQIVASDDFLPVVVLGRLRGCRYILRSLSLILVGVWFRWGVKFSIIGYHYILRGSRVQKVLQLRVGLKYRVFIVFPSSITVFLEKRRFVLIGSDLFCLLNISSYIKNLRNLLPYKNKGISFEITADTLKQGKKARMR